MPDLRKLFNVPSAPQVDLPTEGPDNILDQILRAISTGIGLEEQKPGDLPSAIGAAASMLPFGGILSKLRKATPAVAGEKALANEALRLPHDISPDVSPYQGVASEEIEKARQMGATGLPTRQTIGGNVNNNPMPPDVEKAFMESGPIITSKKRKPK